MAWIEIPGTNRVYSIDDVTMNIRNNKTGYIRKISYGSINLSLDGRKKRGYTPQRLLYAAIHGVSLDKIPRDIVFAVEDGKISIYTHESIARKNMIKANQKRKQREGGYEKIKIFIDAMIECNKNGDYGKIYEILYSYRNDLIDYTKRGHYVSNKRNAQDLVDIVIENTFNDIKKGATIVLPFGYMIKSIKTLKIRMNEAMKQSKEIRKYLSR